MSAKEIFEKLGYVIREDDNQDLVYIKTFQNKPDYFLVFYKNTKDFEKYKNKTNISLCINIEELQAINKQIEELGWNNETHKS